MTEIHKNSLGYKILTNTGYKDFDGISFNGIQDVYKITLENGLETIATDNHEIYTDWFVSKPISKLKVGNDVLTSDGYSKIVSIEQQGKQEVYDVLEVDGVDLFLPLPGDVDVAANDSAAQRHTSVGVATVGGVAGTGGI